MQWSYHALYVGGVGGPDQAQLAQLGTEGWELTGGGVDYIYFRKPAHPNQTFTFTHKITQIGTTNTVIAPAGSTAAVESVGIILSGQGPPRAITRIALVTADFSDTYWAAEINLNAANQPVVIPVQPLIARNILDGIDLDRGLTAQSVSTVAAPDFTVSFNFVVNQAAA